jgi:hypothetical protein
VVVVGTAVTGLGGKSAVMETMMARREQRAARDAVRVR